MAEGVGSWAVGAAMEMPGEDEAAGFLAVATATMAVATVGATGVAEAGAPLGGAAGRGERAVVWAAGMEPVEEGCSRGACRRRAT